MAGPKMGTDLLLMQPEAHAVAVADTIPITVYNDSILELRIYLADLNEQAQERLDTIMEQMKAAEGVTEELKRTCQMEWVQRCNNIHNRAEEIVLHEMIYS